MTQYVAFLLGINVGKHKRVPMPELKKLLEKVGMQDVTTLLASGNVVFKSKANELGKLESDIEAAVHKEFGFEVGVIAHKMSDISKMVESDPFKAVATTERTRLYATFFNGSKTESIEKVEGFEVFDVKDGVVYSTLDLDKSGTTDAMMALGKAYGKRITTRNWNTIEKIAKLAE